MRIEKPVQGQGHGQAIVERLSIPKRPPRLRGLDGESAEGVSVVGPPSGGPLGLRGAEPPGKPATGAGIGPVGAVADRIVSGRTRAGEAEVRIDLGAEAGAFRGCEARLVAGRHGVEAVLIAPTEAARRVIEARLCDLARSLEARGVPLQRVRAMSRAELQRRQAQGETI